MNELFPYQIRGVKKISKFKGRALLSDEQGLGKSRQCLQWAKENKAWPMVIVCPAHVKYHWQDEISKYLHLDSEILETRTPLKRISQKKIQIINYDILFYWLEYFQNLSPCLVVLDECQDLISRTTKRTKACRELCKEIPFVIAASGTPLVNRPAELWPTLNIIKPDLFPSFWHFAMRYCAAKRKFYGWDFSGSSHLDELNKILKKNLMIRRTKAQVLKDLPEKSRHVVPLDIKNRKEYEWAVDDFLVWLASKSEGKARSAAKAEKITKMGYLKRLAAKLKMSFVIDWIDSFLSGSDEKLILYGVHKKILRKLYKKYNKLSVLVDGSVPSKERSLRVHQFQTDPKTRVFIGNIVAAGSGINLTAASTGAFVELSWTPGSISQCEARPHRIGTKNAVKWFFLVAKGTIEEKLCEIIQRKQANSDQVLDGKDGKESELDIYDLLEKELVKEKR